MKQKAKTWLIAAIAFLELSALSVVLTLFADFDGSSVQKAMGYICGGLFWLGLIVGLVLWIGLNKKLKQAGVFEKMTIKRPAMFNIFSNTTAKAIDVVFFASIVLNIIALFTPLGQGIIGAILIIIFFASFHLHYVTNGKAWAYIME